MKAAGASVERISHRCFEFFGLEVCVPRVGLILNDPDVRGGRGRYDFPLGCLGQLFELTFFPTSLERATP